MDFSLSDKHRKDVEARRREAKRKLDEQRRDQKLKAAMESELQEREDQRLKEAERERLQAEADALLNDGVRFRANLRPVPINRTDDRLILPASALEELERQRALDGGLLTFAVVLPNGTLTHAGVTEFTAEEGTVGVPPRVALCLTKGLGLASLASVGMVEVRFVRLPRAAKCIARLQPRGEGFHAGGLVAVRMDLEHILHESLRGHIALTEGDWLPIRHNGVTYELVVRELAPEPRLALLDTELEVDILPSEQTEAEMQAAEEAKAAEERAQQAAQAKEAERVLRAQKKAALLGEEPAAAPDVVQLLLRLPDGQRLQRRFAKAALLANVLDWVESEPSSMVEPGKFCVVQKWPGHCRELGVAEAPQQLSALGFARQEALFLQHLTTEDEGKAAAASAGADEQSPTMADGGAAAGEASDEVQRFRLASRSQLQGGGGGAAGSTSTANRAAGTEAWAAAEQRAREMLDARLEGRTSPTNQVSEDPELQEVRGQELVDVFERLVALGMNPQEAASAAKRFASQLKELGEMGFGDWVRAVQLLQKYNGRLLRVANLLSEAGEDDGDVVYAGSGTTVTQQQEPVSMDVDSPPAAPAAPSQESTSKRLPQGLEAKFKELVAAGVPPNEAAAKAIQLAKAAPPPEGTGSSTAAAQQAPPAVQPSPEVPGESKLSNFDEQLAALSDMGFTDVDRNLTLLRKYAGRTERVIAALCE